MNFKLNKEYFKNTLQGAFDVSFRDIKVHQEECFLCFLNSLCDASLISEIVKGLYLDSDDKHIALYTGTISECKDKKQALTAILSGQCLLLHQNIMYLIESRNYPNRATNEATNEQSIRGSHDGFVENIIMNVGLIRRRIRDERLQIKLHQEGVKSKTDIAYLYIKGLVNQVVLDDFIRRLSQIDTLEVLYDRSFCDALYGKSYNPYPYIRYCERPDICAIHLLQGYIVVLIDNSFNAIIIPTTFFELTKQIEEYTQVSSISIVIRLVRLLAIFLSLYMMPIWFLIQVTHNSTLLNIPIVDMGSAPLLIFQFLFVELLVEWIRLSYVHTPQSINGVLAFLFIFLLGESAVNLNLYSEVILVFVVLCNICNFVTPNYELSLANKCFRILMSVLTIFFKLPGFCLGIFLHVWTLLYTKSIHFSYLYPLIPFDYKEMKRLLLGAPIKIKK